MSPATPNPGGPAATAVVHMRWRDTERAMPVPVPSGETTLLGLLPSAREITRQTTALAVEQVRAEGKEISCRAGCGACCRQLVAISFVEAQSLADVVAAMPAERQAEIRRRFAEALSRLERAGLLDPGAPKGERAIQIADVASRAVALQAAGRGYFQQQIACPFLENESCGIYEDRPIVCREYHVTSPAANCTQLYQIQIDRVEPPVHVGEVLARTADRVSGIGPFMIPLVLSLEWSEAHGSTLKQPHDGRRLFQTMMEELQNPTTTPPTAAQ